MLFGYNGELLFCSEIVTQRAGYDGGNGYDKESEGIYIYIKSIRKSQKGSVQIASDGVRYSVEINSPFGGYELSVGIFNRMVYAQISDSGNYSDKIVGNIGENADPKSVQRTGLKSF